VKKVADQMTEEGLLLRSRRKSGESRPGRAPATYEIVGDERGEAEAVLAASGPPGALSRDQQLVVASIPGAKVAELRRVTSRSLPASQIEWVALVDGDPQQCLMAFAGENAVGLANNLIDQLDRAEIDCRRATVAQVLLGHRFTASS
jgi:hypothetical protein